MQAETGNNTLADLFQPAIDEFAELVANVRKAAESGDELEADRAVAAAGAWFGACSSC